MMWIGPWEVSEGAVYPADNQAESGQFINEDGDGDIIVNETSYDVEFLQLTINVTRALGENIYGYIRHGVRYAAIPFVYIDDDGISHWVRYWGKRKIKMTKINTGYVQMKLLLRKEVS